MKITTEDLGKYVELELKIKKEDLADRLGASTHLISGYIQEVGKDYLKIRTPGIGLSPLRRSKIRDIPFEEIKEYISLSAYKLKF